MYRDSERFGKQQHNLVSQSKLFDTIFRHSIEISENDLPNAKNSYYLTTMNSDFELRYRSAELGLVHMEFHVVIIIVMT